MNIPQFIVIVDIQELYALIAPAIDYITELNVIDSEDQESFFDWCVEEAIERFYDVSVEPHMSLHRCINKTATTFSYDHYSTFNEWQNMYDQHIEMTIHPFIQAKFGELGLEVQPNTVIKVLVTYTNVFLAITPPVWAQYRARSLRRF